MDHRKLDTTRQYYCVGEKRRREAVDRVAAMQFDRHGNRIWRTARALLDSEHVRRSVGEVTVPFGVCAEPSNVKAGGNACPYRFRCAGCDHFRTDVSYLPDLQTYLDDLLRNRERALAATDIEEWAKTEAMPSQDEITRIRRPIARITGDLGQLTTSERTQIDQAVAAVRRHRAAMLGMPPHSPGRCRRDTPGAHRMNSTPATASPAAAMAEGRRADSARRRQRVLKALNAATASGEDITVTSIARLAGVDRTFLYRHRDLLEQIHALEAQPPSTPGTGPVVSRASLQADLLAAQQRAARLAARVQQLEHCLSELLGQKHGMNRASAPPPTSMPSTRRSPTSNSTSPTCVSSSKNATRTSTPPAPPTASSWPRSTLPRTRHRHATEVLAPHLSHSLNSQNQPATCKNAEKGKPRTGWTPREAAPRSPRDAAADRDHPRPLTAPDPQESNSRSCARSLTRDTIMLVV
jgi:hypothetical protein